MGNTRSSSSTHTDHNRHRKASTANPVALECFSKITECRNRLTKGEFEKLLGPKIGTLLWEHVFHDKNEVGETEFSRHYYELSDINPSQCSKMFPDIETFLDACLSTVGKSLKDEHADFVSSFVRGAEREGSARYFGTWFPGLVQSTVIQHIKDVFCPSSERVVFTVDSAILSPLQMLIVQGSLPEMVYFKYKQTEHPCWSKIYDSHLQGLSVNRFEANVFGYKAPTVSIFKLTDGRIFVIASNVEWRHSTKYYGTSLCKCIQIAPHFKFIETRHEEPIMCNFKFRTATLGLAFTDSGFTINAEFDNLDAIEVWGCGDKGSLSEQKSAKQRQQAQVERNQKVSMPGNWDENPDKQILEMGGHHFSSERNKPQPPHDSC